MDEIYISWEDSVNAAYRRYGEILRMKADGELEVRKKVMSDRLLDVTADFIDTFSFMTKTRKELFESFRENMYGMKENIAEAGHHISDKAENMKAMLHGYEENVREELKKAWKWQDNARRTAFDSAKRGTISLTETVTGAVTGAAKTGTSAVKNATLTSANAVTNTAQKIVGASDKTTKE